MNWTDTKEQEEFRIAVQNFIKDRLPDYYVKKSKDPAGTDLQPDENGIQYHEDWQHDLALGSDEAKIEYECRLDVRFGAEETDLLDIYLAKENGLNPFTYFSMVDIGNLIQRMILVL